MDVGSTSSADAPGAAVKSAAESVSAAARTTAAQLPGKLSLDEERLEEVYSGALDGLSGADIAPAVEELQRLGAKIGRALAELLPNVATQLRGLFGGGGTEAAVSAAAPAVPPIAALTGLHSQQLEGLLLSGAALPSAASLLAGAMQQPLLMDSWITSRPLTGMGRWAAQIADAPEVEQVAAAGDASRGLFRQVALVELSDLAVPADIGFSAAASNAVNTAVKREQPAEQRDQAAAAGGRGRAEGRR